MIVQREYFPPHSWRLPDTALRRWRTEDKCLPCHRRPVTEWDDNTKDETTAEDEHTPPSLAGDVPYLSWLRARLLLSEPRNVGEIGRVAFRDLAKGVDRAAHPRAEVAGGIMPGASHSTAVAEHSRGAGDIAAAAIQNVHHDVLSPTPPTVVGLAIIPVVPVAEIARAIYPVMLAAAENVLFVLAQPQPATAIPAHFGSNDVFLGVRDRRERAAVRAARRERVVPLGVRAEHGVAAATPAGPPALLGARSACPSAYDVHRLGAGQVGARRNARRGRRKVLVEAQATPSAVPGLHAARAPRRAVAEAPLPAWLRTVDLGGGRLRREMSTQKRKVREVEEKGHRHPLEAKAERAAGLGRECAESCIYSQCCPPSPELRRSAQRDRSPSLGRCSTTRPRTEDRFRRNSSSPPATLLQIWAPSNRRVPNPSWPSYTRAWW